MVYQVWWWSVANAGQRSSLGQGRRPTRSQIQSSGGNCSSWSCAANIFFLDIPIQGLTTNRKAHRHLARTINIVIVSVKAHYQRDQQASSEVVLFQVALPQAGRHARILVASNTFRSFPALLQLLQLPSPKLCVYQTSQQHHHHDKHACEASYFNLQEELVDGYIRFQNPSKPCQLTI